MSTTGATTPGAIEERPGHRSNGRGHTARRLLTETKASFKTSEFFAFLVVARRHPDLGGRGRRDQ